MKQINKNYLFSNFNSDIDNKCINKSNLTISSIYNLTLENNIIEPTFNFTNLFEEILSKDTFDEFYDLNKEFLNSVIHVEIYDFIYENQNCKRIFLITSEFKLFEINLNSLEIINLQIVFKSKPTIINEDSKIYFISYNDILISIYNFENPIYVSSFCNIIEICSHTSMIYFTINKDYYKIYLTEKCEISNISDNISFYDFIEVNKKNGKILNILNFKDNIYIIQQYDICKLTYSSGKYILHSYCSIESKIYGNSIAKIDDYILFYTTAGLFQFDGNDTKQLFSKITSNIKSEKNIAVAFNNKYYLSTVYMTNNKLEHLLLEFNLENENCNIYNIGQIENIYITKTFSTYMLNALTISDGHYKILTLNDSYNNFHKFIRFNKLTFDDNNIKVFNSIKFIGLGRFVIKIGSDIASTTIECNDNYCVQSLGLKGHYFEIELSSNFSFSIELILINITNIEE